MEQWLNQSARCAILEPRNYDPTLDYRGYRFPLSRRTVRESIDYESSGLM